MRMGLILLVIVTALWTPASPAGRFGSQGEGVEVLWDTYHGNCHGEGCDFENLTRLFEIFEEEGIYITVNDLGILNQDLSRFKGLIISAISARYSSYTEAEASLIESFVMNGGGVIILGECPTAIFYFNGVPQRFGVTLLPILYVFPPILHPIIQHPIFEGVEEIAVSCAGQLDVGSPSISAASNTEGEVGIAVAEVGEGRVVVTGDHSIFMNCCYFWDPNPPGCCDPNDNEIFTRNVIKWLFNSCRPVEPPSVRSQGYWRRQCMENPHEDICALVEGVHELSDHFDSFNCDAVCDLMLVDPPENEMCRKAERQFMALLLNIASDKLSLCNCLLDGRTIEDVIAEIEGLLSDSQILNSGSENHASCERAMSLAEGINSGESLVNCQSYSSPFVLSSPLYHISPNPFFNSTLIQYETPIIQPVQLKVYDLMGRLVKVLVNEVQGAGSYRVEWRGLDEKGEKVPGGVYFARIQSGEEKRTLKFILLK